MVLVSVMRSIFTFLNVETSHPGLLFTDTEVPGNNEAV